MSSASLALRPVSKPGIATSPYLWFAAAPLLLGPIWALIGPTLAGPQLGTFAGAVLLQLLVCVVVTDLRSKRIRNWATYPAFVWALVIALVGWLSGYPQWLTTVTLTDSLAGGFGLFFLMMVIFSLTGGGSGDVKLAACLGALLGWNMGFEALLYSYVIGGAVTLAVSMVTHGPLTLFSAMFRSLGSLVLPRVIAPPPKHARQLLKSQVPLAAFFAAGALLAVYQGGLLTRIFGG